MLLGTFIGAYIITKIATSYQFSLAMSIGGFFLISGIAMVFILPAPVWFICADLLVAYIPMGYL
jgi:uncharacterized membrane protein YqgA involved in biofilm formation